jgi:hypothetical protein
MRFLKECLRMEEICRELALREPHNQEQWRAKARVWHQRAGSIVIGTFGDVPIILLKDKESYGPGQFVASSTQSS